MAFEPAPQGRNRLWQVGALCRAVADMLDARFGPVSVQGELSGFSRAASGHCYFSLKDATGQLRCAKAAYAQLGRKPKCGQCLPFARNIISDVAATA